MTDKPEMYAEPIHFESQRDRGDETREDGDDIDTGGVGNDQRQMGKECE